MKVDSVVADRGGSAAEITIIIHDSSETRREGEGNRFSITLSLSLYQELFIMFIFSNSWRKLHFPRAQSQRLSEEV